MVEPAIGVRGDWHAVAHALEDACLHEGRALGHAHLVRATLAPGLRLNRRSATWCAHFDRHALDLDVIEAVADRLACPASWRGLAPLLEREWETVLRDPSARINGALVRRGDLAHFMNEAAA